MSGRQHISAVLSAATFTVAAALGSSAHAEMPALVAAYTQQLVAQCGGVLSASLAAQVVTQIDLNGDKVDDWVVDAGRYPCSTRSPVFADQGSQVTIFIGRPDGRALPAFQRVAFGSHLENNASAGRALWVTLGGRDCGDDNPKARCERQVAWQATGQRFDLVPEARKTPAASTPPRR